MSESGTGEPTRSWSSRFKELNAEKAPRRRKNSSTGSGKAERSRSQRQPTMRRGKEIVKRPLTKEVPSPAAQPIPVKENGFVKMVAKEGSTRYAQMRKFLEKANQAVAHEPVDILGSILGLDKSKSTADKNTTENNNSLSLPSGGWLSTTPPRSPDRDYRTGLTPTHDHVPSPVVAVRSVRRDSDDLFAASDLYLDDYSNAKVGTFLHGQRSAHLRQKLAAATSKKSAVTKHPSVLIEDIPDLHAKLAKQSQEEIVRRILVNTAENEEEERDAWTRDVNEAGVDTCFTGA